MNERFKPYVPQVHFELIPIKNLVSSQDYQRSVSSRQIATAATEFDVNQINPVKVSRRNGKNYVFNGQHTIEIVATVSGSRDTPVWCMIYDDLVYEHEADIFANQSKYVRPLTPYDIFVANIEAGNQEQIMIKELVESYGLTISNKDAPGNICAVATIQDVMREYGYANLDHTLRLCIGTWEGTAHSLGSLILKSISILLYVYGEELNDEVFKEKLGSISIKEILRNAKERRSGVVGYAEAMLAYYSKGTRGGRNWLSPEKLYSDYFNA
ncbi:MAG: hypothetical protein Q4B26_16290 [Eubacteriales bacterium]|nr:hypothetical protein [Eubacteriales bacterium]